MTKKLPVILAAAAVAALALVPAQRAAAQPVTVRVDTPEFGFRIGMPVYPAPVLVAPVPVHAPPPSVYAPPRHSWLYPPVVYAPPPRVICRAATGVRGTAPCLRGPALDPSGPSPWLLPEVDHIRGTVIVTMGIVTEPAR